MTCHSCKEGYISLEKATKVPKAKMPHEKYKTTLYCRKMAGLFLVQRRAYFCGKCPMKNTKKLLDCSKMARCRGGSCFVVVLILATWLLLPSTTSLTEGGGDTQHVAKQPPSPSYIDDFLNWNVNLFVTILIKGGQIVSGPRWRPVRRQFSLLLRPPFILWHFPPQVENFRYFG